ncbi:MAG: amidohydrolase family protein, partial [Desulfonatronovibrio sp.]
FHIGDRLPPEINPSSPEKLAVIRKKFPKLTIVAAHLGGYLHWGESVKHLAGTGVFLDTSSSLPFIKDDDLKKILRIHPLERILFGSDYPLFDPVSEIRLLKEKAGFNDREIAQILDNGLKLIF